MPCEACNAQFTVFKRKRSCSECRRLYCSNCLSKCKERALCERCVIFNTRPLSKIELLKLKAKDLIFYLQSKHISTTGCVEKEELVNLVLIHVNNYSPDSQASGRNQYENSDDRSNPFDQIKNTCQNLFTTFTEKIAADLNFDMKSPQSGHPPNIFAQQPRRSSSNARNYQPPYYSAAATSPQHQQPSYVSPAPPPGQSSSGDSVRGSNSSSASPTSPMQANFQSPTTSSSGSSTMGNATAQSKESTNSRVKANSGNNIRAAPNDGGRSGQTSSGSKQDAKSDRSNSERMATKKRLHVDHLIDVCGNVSGCECSDDEIITNFKVYSRNNSVTMANAKCDEQEAGPSGSAGSSVKTTANSRSPNCHGLGSDDSSDVSSFEDLGASGQCGSTSIDAETWQIINNQTFPGDASSPVGSTSRTLKKNDGASSTERTLSVSSIIPTTSIAPTIHSGQDETSPALNAITAANMPRRSPPDITCTLVSDDTSSRTRQAASDTFQAHSSNQTDTFNQKNYSAIPKFKPNRKISRRRSDCIVYAASSAATRHNLLDDDEDAAVPEDIETDADESSACERPGRQHRRPRKSCHKCGKTKGDIRKHIDRFRKQLETTTTANEAEIKQQLEEFLNFLESRSRNSIDDGIEGGSEGVLPHSEDIDSPTEGETYGDEDDTYDEYGFDDDTGIHVYGTNDETASSHPPRQFINIGDFDTMESLEDLTVKQLKEILMLNRIDFKGCCEKSELLERVQRLWQDMQNCPAVEKLPSDDLCKICMDAPIECVLLECGHMATCTSCGKVLSECPICRQYIVRVVRFFKA